MIQERAMLAAVHISIWTAVKHDRGVSRDVAERNGAHQGAGRYNKQLLRGAGEFEAQLLDGTVGQAASGELLAFLRLFRQLPSIDEILLNPETAPLPTETSCP